MAFCFSDHIGSKWRSAVSPTVFGRSRWAAVLKWEHATRAVYDLEQILEHYDIDACASYLLWIQIISVSQKTRYTYESPNPLCFIFLSLLRYHLRDQLQAMSGVRAVLVVVRYRQGQRRQGHLTVLCVAINYSKQCQYSELQGKGLKIPKFCWAAVLVYPEHSFSFHVASI